MGRKSTTMTTTDRDVRSISFSRLWRDLTKSLLVGLPARWMTNSFDWVRMGVGVLRLSEHWQSKKAQGFTYMLSQHTTFSSNDRMSSSVWDLWEGSTSLVLQNWAELAVERTAWVAAHFFLPCSICSLQLVA